MKALQHQSENKRGEHKIDEKLIKIAKVLPIFGLLWLFLHNVDNFMNSSSIVIPIVPFLEVQIPLASLGLTSTVTPTASSLVTVPSVSVPNGTPFVPTRFPLVSRKWNVYCRQEADSSMSLGQHGFKVDSNEVFVKVGDPAPLSNRKCKIYTTLNSEEKINFEIEYKVGVHGGTESVSGVQLWLGVISLCKCVNEPIGNYFIFQERSGEKYAIIGNGAKSFASKSVHGKVNGQIAFEHGWADFLLRDSNNNILLKRRLVVHSDCGDRYGLLVGYQVQAGYSLTGTVRFH